MRAEWPRSKCSLRSLPPSKYVLLIGAANAPALTQPMQELLENSLDAGAKRVEVELEAGGVDLLRITDDGGGIPAESLPLLGQPHHTSKIDSLDALSRLASYGFRGEALHAIVESSTAVVVKSALPNGPCMQHTLGSQDQPAAASTPIRWTHGELVKSGTCVEVRGLFAKYPVRRKSAQSEDFMKKLLFLLTSYGIARPAVHLAAYFRRPASACFIKAPQPDVATTILAQFGPDAAACVELVPSRALPFGLTLSCLLPVPHRAAESLRSRPDRSFYYVNTRPVDMPVLAKLLNKRLRAYTAATSRTHAMCVVLITSPPNLIDVNLSPDKRKLYFQGHVAKALGARTLHPRRRSQSLCRGQVDGLAEGALPPAPRRRRHRSRLRHRGA